MTEAQLVEWFQHIVVSPIRIANKLLPAMRARGWGRIIVVGSTGMQQPIPTLALSNTLRASIWAWLKTMSGEVAKDGVTMNVLAPGTILNRPDQGSGGSGGATKEYWFRGGSGRAGRRGRDTDPCGTGGDARRIRTDGRVPGQR